MEVFKEVCTPSNADDYQYIGFGASFFADFKMVHRELGVTKLVSIEGNSSQSNIKRCNFNKPFNCIVIIPGWSYQVLPKLSWTKKSIVWLDYDKRLQNYMFEDIETCCQMAQSGGFLVLSLRREFDQKNLRSFTEEFDEKVPSTLTKEGIEPVNCNGTIRDMFLNKIKDTLLSAYSTKPPEDRLVFKQIFNFSYRDDAPMYTLGGMFIKKNEETVFDNYKFNSHAFVTDGETPVNISFPIITTKEFLEMNQLLPAQESDFMSNALIDFIPKEHRKNFFNTYKQFPAYIETSNF